MRERLNAVAIMLADRMRRRGFDVPRNISFALTTQQIKDRTKTVTRRQGWLFLKRGEILNACVKCMGLQPGEQIERLGQIRVVDVRREPLDRMHMEKDYGRLEASKEGFPEMTGARFVTMFMDHMGGRPEQEVTRIEFEYLGEECGEVNRNVPTEIEESLMSEGGTEVDEVVADDEVTEQPESVPLSELERSHYEEIRKLEELASEAEEEFDQVNAQAKALKKRWEGKVEVLRSVIRRGVNPQRSLPFGDDEDEQPEAWRIVAIDTVLDLSDKQATLLQEAGILTVEQFENLRAGEGLTSLAGVGQSTAEKWEDQMLTWLAANAREADEPEDDEDAENSQDGDEPADED